MRIMWVSAAPMGVLAAKFGMNVLGSGGWIDACLKSLCIPEDKDLYLHYFAIRNKNDCYISESEGVTYYLTDIKKSRGDRINEASVKRWKQYIDEIKPDLIQIWGTEYSLGMEVEAAADNTPVIFYIQGIMKCLDEHRDGDFPTNEYFRYCGIETLPKLVKSYFDRKAISHQARYEAEMICKSHGIIVDTEWSQAQYRKYTEKSYNIPLPINTVFFEKEWKLDHCERLSAFTIAGRTPLKGLHIALCAWEEVVKRYPTATLYIPGNVSSKSPKIIYEPLYIKYLRKFIADKKLENNIVFLGRLSQSEMASRMSECNVFIMPSCIENHSSTLREAMIVGAPCVSSFVGSVGEFITNGENGFVYRYNEKDTLAYYVMKLFEDDNLAMKISENSKKTIKTHFPQESIGEKLKQLYLNVSKEK